MGQSNGYPDFRYPHKEFIGVYVGGIDHGKLVPKHFAGHSDIQKHLPMGIPLRIQDVRPTCVSLRCCYRRLGQIVNYKRNDMLEIFVDLGLNLTEEIFNGNAEDFFDLYETGYRNHCDEEERRKTQKEFDENFANIVVPKRFYHRYRTMIEKDLKEGFGVKDR